MVTTNVDTLKNISLDFTGTTEELKTLISLLEFELQSNPGQNGVGLAAIQINIPLRVAIIRNGKEAFNLYKAKIIKAEQPFIFEQEGCLSFPNQYYNTNRYNLIEVLNGNGEILKFSGFNAVIASHEIDHWNSVIFTEKING